MKKYTELLTGFTVDLSSVVAIGIIRDSGNMTNIEVTVCESGAYHTMTRSYDCCRSASSEYECARNILSNSYKEEYNLNLAKIGADPKYMIH